MQATPITQSSLKRHIRDHAADTGENGFIIMTDAPDALRRRLLRSGAASLSWTPDDGLDFSCAAAAAEYRLTFLDECEPTMHNQSTEAILRQAYELTCFLAKARNVTLAVVGDPDNALAQSKLSSLNERNIVLILTDRDWLKDELIAYNPHLLVIETKGEAQ